VPTAMPSTLRMSPSREENLELSEDAMKDGKADKEEN